MDPLSFLGACITGVFLLIVLSYYALLALPRRRRGKPLSFKSITVIMPAHNEQDHLAMALNAVLDATFHGKKDVIVVDDGSTDMTYKIACAFKAKGVTVLRTAHKGKSKSINLALRRAKGQLVAVVDADSFIAKDALAEAVMLFDAQVGVVCSTVKVRNKNTFLGAWLQVEQLYNSLLRGLFSKMNVNIVAPGPLSVYRKDLLKRLGGFEHKGFSEDVDIAVRMIKLGYRVEYAEKAVSETVMPISPKGFWMQRRRFSRGWITILKRHLRLNKSFVEIYTLPLALFWYFQALIMGVITIMNIAVGYYTYFLSKGIWMNWYVARFFLEWFSLVGLLRWFWNIASGMEPLTAFAAISLMASLLVYPLYVYAIVRFERRITFRDVLVLLFMFPFWFVLMVINVISIPEYFSKRQRNIWEK